MSASRLLNWSYALLFFLVPFLFTPNNFELFEFNKMIAVYALTAIIVCLWLVKMLTEGRIIFRRSFLDLPLIIFLGSQLISTVFSIDPHVSLWGYYSRFNGGLISLICYSLLFWAYVSNFSPAANSKSESTRPISPEVATHLKFLLASAVIVSLYALSEHFGVSPSCVLIYQQVNTACWVQDVQTRVFATLGQPNWLAAWLVAIAPLAWLLALSHDNKSIVLDPKKGVFWTGTGFSALLFLIVIYTKSRSGLLGFALSTVVFCSALTLSRLRNKAGNTLLKPLACWIFSLLFILALSGSPFNPSLFDLVYPKPPSIEPATAAPALEGGGTETGAIRKIVWKGAIDVGLSRPLFGTGVETFAESYYQHRPIAHNDVSEWDFLYNKAHNEFLNYFATTGFVGLGSYLILISAFILWSLDKLIKPRLSNPLSEPKLVIVAALLAGYLSILVTNFFGFSVVNVQLLFFLFPAISIVTVSDTPHFLALPFRPLGKIRLTLTLAAVAMTIFLIVVIARMWLADTHYAKANQSFHSGSSQQAFLEARQAVALSESEPTFRDLLAQSAASLAALAAQQNQATLAAQLSLLATQESDSVVKTSPYNLQFWTSRTRIFYTLADANLEDPTSHLNTALSAITHATQLAPTHPKMYYNLALIQLRLGQIDPAYKSLVKAISLKPNYKDPRHALALTLAKDGKYSEALAQAQFILEKIDPADTDIQALAASWSGIQKDTPSPKISQ